MSLLFYSVFCSLYPMLVSSSFKIESSTPETLVRLKYENPNTNQKLTKRSFEHLEIVHSAPSANRDITWQPTNRKHISKSKGIFDLEENGGLSRTNMLVPTYSFPLPVWQQRDERIHSNQDIKELVNTMDNDMFYINDDYFRNEIIERDKTVIQDEYLSDGSQTKNGYFQKAKLQTTSFKKPISFEKKGIDRLNLDDQYRGSLSQGQNKVDMVDPTDIEYNQVVDRVEDSNHFYNTYPRIHKKTVSKNTNKNSRTNKLHRGWSKGKDRKIKKNQKTKYERNQISHIQVTNVGFFNYELARTESQSTSIPKINLSISDTYIDADFISESCNKTICQNETISNDFWNQFYKSLSHQQFSWLDIIVTVACTTAFFLLVVNVAYFVQYCYSNSQRRRYSPSASEHCIYGYGVAANENSRLIDMCWPCLRCCNIENNFANNSASTNGTDISTVFGTMEMGTQYDNSDVMIPSFITEELIGELNDRDSTCTSISDGFTYARDFSTEIREYKVGITEL